MSQKVKKRIRSYDQINEITLLSHMPSRRSKKIMRDRNLIEHVHLLIYAEDKFSGRKNERNDVETQKISYRPVSRVV